MDFHTITMIWFFFGLALVLAEMLIPGLVVIFLGVGAMLVALLRFVGILQSEINSFTTWFILSLVLILALRWVFLRIFPPESAFVPTKEDEDSYGTIVEVIEKIQANNTEGRIRFRGTTWPAICSDGIIPKGQKVKLLYRDNLSWVVESVPEQIE